MPTDTLALLRECRAYIKAAAEMVDPDDAPEKARDLLARIDAELAVARETVAWSPIWEDSPDIQHAILLDGRELYVRDDTVPGSYKKGWTWAVFRQEGARAATLGGLASTLDLAKAAAEKAAGVRE